MKKILVTLFASLILTACVTDNNKTTSSQPEINQISDIPESMRTISKKQVPANIMVNLQELQVMVELLKQL